MRRSRIIVAALAALALIATAGVVTGDAAAKGKKKKAANKVKTFQNAAAQSIPDRPAGVDTTLGTLNSTITVGKKLKGKEIADVDVSIGATHTDLSDLDFWLTAPDGASVFLTGDNSGAGGAATTYGTGGGCGGTLTTFSDETANFISNDDPPGVFPGEVFSPWAATVRPGGFPLRIMDGGPAQGTWTLRVYDFVNGDVGTLTCWKLSIKPRNKLPT